MLTDKSVSDLLDAFSSSDPTPGGGSASALSGALAASLLAMVAGMPKTKTGTPEARAALDRARTGLLQARAALVDLVDRDAASYDLVVAAFRRPKSTDEEKAARRQAIQDATRVATEVPLETIRACASVTRLAREVADYGNPSAKSDIGVAAHLLMAARQGAWLNIAINIGGLPDEGLAQAIGREAASLNAHEADDLAHVFQAAGLIDLLKEATARLGHRPSAHPSGRD